ncbi:MAG: hypothetical protein ACRENA_02555 [Vulcanimicrobiaceae bacterium]
MLLRFFFDIVVDRRVVIFKLLVATIALALFLRQYRAKLNLLGIRKRLTAFVFTFVVH